MIKRLLVMLVQDYLIGERTLDELQMKLIDTLWADRAVQPVETLDLAQLLDVHIAEFTGGHIDQNELRRRLIEAAEISASETVYPDESRSPVEFGSGSRTERQSAAFG